jgi:hypothetical protein
VGFINQSSIPKGLRVGDIRFMVHDLRLTIHDLQYKRSRFRVYSLGFRILGFRVKGF